MKKLFFLLILFASTAHAQQVDVERVKLVHPTSPCVLRTGTGTPEGVVTGNVCDIFIRNNGAEGTIVYVKNSGTGNTGWGGVGGATGAPTSATYITQTADGTLTNEQAIGALSTGIMLVTTSTGVITSFTSTDGNILIGTTASGWVKREISDCDNAFGQHLNYDSTGNTFVCGTSAPGDGTTPTISSGFGTSPTIQGDDFDGRVTVGSGGIAATGTVAFENTYSSAPKCVANNESTIQLVQATATTTTLVLTSSIAWGASDKLTWVCGGGE